MKGARVQVGATAAVVAIACSGTAAHATPIVRTVGGVDVKFEDDDGGGAPQNLTVTQNGAQLNDPTVPFFFTDSAGPLLAGEDCTQVTANSVSCLGVNVYVNLKGQDDRLKLTGTVRGTAVLGGSGNDVFENSAPSAYSSIRGGPGNDTFALGTHRGFLYGEDGSDYFPIPPNPRPASPPPAGTAGTMTIEGGRGIDVFDDRAFSYGTVFRSGDTDRDVIDYSARTAPVNIGGLSESGPYNGGEAGEEDAVVWGIGDLHGGSANDRIVGRRDFSPRTRMFGNGGDDYFEPLGGNDEIYGGSGLDRVTYHTITQPVFVNLNGRTDDGPAGEDNIQNDVEQVRGGQAGDKLIGNSANNTFWGNEGDDYLEGLGGADHLWGGTGAGDRADYQSAIGPVSISPDNTSNDGVAGEGDNVHDDVEGLRGGAFGDTIVGGPGANVIWGRNGGDSINPGAGADTVDAGDGGDTINTVDGVVDTVACGAGIDQPIADVSDQLAADCETAGAS